MRARRVSTILRSRKYATRLIAAVSLWAITGSTLSAKDLVPSWLDAIGGPFANPVFLVLAAWLIVSTAACAQERTTRALRLRRALRHDPAGLLDETGRVVSGGVSPDEAIEAAGLRPRHTDGVVIGTSRVWALWGSPVFHWGLVVTLGFAALGQVVRAEGVLQVAEGSSITDERASYAPGLTEGLFFLGLTGLDVEVTGFETSVMVDGVEMGASPRVRLAQGEREVAEGLVYPNSPLRHGSLTVHRRDTARGAIIDITFENSQTVTGFLVPFTETDAGLAPVNVEIMKPNSEPVAITFSAEKAGRLGIAAESTGESLTVESGSSVELADGTVFRFVRPTFYANLGMVHDWTLPFIWAGFILAALGLAVAMFAPTRAIIISVEEGRTRAAILSQRVDPGFRWIAESVFEQAAAGSDSEVH